MKKFKFKPGHEDALIPFPYIKGSVVNTENCTDEIVETIQKKFPQYAHNFVDADYVEETNSGNQEIIETNLEEMKVPALKKLAFEKGLSFEGNPSKEELINLIKAN